MTELKLTKLFLDSETDFSIRKWIEAITSDIHSFASQPDVFLLFEECADGTATASSSLRQIHHVSRVNEISAYHLMAVHPTAHGYVVRDLHNVVHMGILSSSVLTLMEVLLGNYKHPIVYYSSSIGCLKSDFATVVSGSSALHQCPSFQNLSFHKVFSLVHGVKPGIRKNQQLNYGLATQNHRRLSSDDSINHPTIKKQNMQDDVIQEFITMSTFLNELDPDNQFHLPAESQPSEIVRDAQAIVSHDKTLHKSKRTLSYLHGISLLINSYGDCVNNSRVQVFGDSPSASSGDTVESTSNCSNSSAQHKSAHKMRQQFERWWIALSDVCVFPHVDHSNGHTQGN